jgi:hypothetical protein
MYTTQSRLEMKGQERGLCKRGAAVDQVITRYQLLQTPYLLQNTMHRSVLCSDGSCVHHYSSFTPSSRRQLPSPSCASTHGGNIPLGRNESCWGRCSERSDCDIWGGGGGGVLGCMHGKRYPAASCATLCGNFGFQRAGTPLPHHSTLMEVFIKG